MEPEITPSLPLVSTSRERPKSLYLRLKKSKGEPFGDKKISLRSRSVEKTRKGDPSLSSGSVGYVKKVINQRETLWRQKKIRKKSHSGEKTIGRGDPSVSSGFV